MDSKDFFRSAMVKEEEREAGFPMDVMAPGDEEEAEAPLCGVLVDLPPSSFASMALNSLMEVLFHPTSWCCSARCLAMASDTLLLLLLLPPPPMPLTPSRFELVLLDLATASLCSTGEARLALDPCLALAVGEVGGDIVPLSKGDRDPRTFLCESVPSSVLATTHCSSSCPSSVPLLLGEGIGLISGIGTSFSLVTVLLRRRCCCCC